MIDLVFNNKTKYSIPDQKYFFNIFVGAAKILKLGKKRYELSLNLIGERQILALNKKYRKKNKATDVLSFPIADDKLKKYGIMPLGDIFICPDFVARDSKSREVSFNEEITRVAIHGFLHLLGYDHEMSTAEHDKMINLQERLLSKLLK